MRRAAGDRRTRVRFEAFGAFWGTFDVDDAVRVRNLTHHGALIETRRPLAVESVQALCLMLEGQPAIANARVRYVADAGASNGHCYLVGVEFVSTSTAFHDAVDQLISYRACRTEHL
jgi:hypothetical protein